jgi:Ssp1 endopeptidase immunity protein Rap1a
VAFIGWRFFLSAMPFVVGGAFAVMAENIRSSDLMAHCTLSTGPDDYCKGFLNGYSDAGLLFEMNEMLQTPRPSPPGNVPSFCLSNADTDEALAQAFISFMQAHPNRVDEFAGTTVLKALSARYPCKK